MSACLTMREEAAMRILAGFCANPAVFASNSMNGWDLVNCTDKQLVDYAWRLADQLICEIPRIKPTGSLEKVRSPAGPQNSARPNDPSAATTRCALCWNKARVGSVCDTCHDSMGTQATGGTT